MDVQEKLQKVLHEFLDEYCGFLPPSIPELDKIPTPNEFLAEYVLTNIPFILKCPEEERVPAVELWQDENYLRKLMFQKTVTVDVSPDGHADSIRDGLFMIPEERKMTFDSFYTEHKMPNMHQIHYLQKQNNNLHEEFYPLLRDVEGGHCPWATEAFGQLPDASNIWIGDHRSVTSLHRDHYENIYYVIKGKKSFLLYPPIALGWLPYKKCKKFQWQWDGSPEHPKWTMKDMNEEVEWILSDLKPDTPEQFDMYQNTKAYCFDVNPGEVLYLPALWFHQVSQSDGCIAVNYWYDMKYDYKYPFLKLFNNLCNIRNPDRSIPSKSVAVDKPDQ